MFFTPDLLERRESGFGLLWLAATLGAKSSFKKLPRRDVLTANITQLCDLIARPAEPLALRLTSNLMVGVARVYKVKQEIFMTDVSTCFNALKKIAIEIRSATDVQLEMLQPVSKASAVTLATVPHRANLAAFDDLVANWDEYLSIGDNSRDASVDEDGLLDSVTKKSKRTATKSKTASAAETARGDMYTLKEHHEHLLSSSFDLSFSGGADPSSQLDDGFGFDLNFFGPSDMLDIGGIGDELARELGEGWGASPPKHNQQMDIGPSVQSEMDTDNFTLEQGIHKGDLPMLIDQVDQEASAAEIDVNIDLAAQTPCKRSHKRKVLSGSNKENETLSPIASSPLLPVAIPEQGMSLALTFSHLLLSQDLEARQPLADITATEQNAINVAIKKTKKARLLLDARTELTDEELKAARAQYLQGQYLRRREMNLKKAEKESGRLIEEIVWGAPNGIHAQALVEFWQENFKVQVEARTGALHIHPPDEPPRKRRKVKASPRHPEVEVVQRELEIEQLAQEFDIGMPTNPGDDGDINQDHERLRSSEEPGQGRNASRPPSIPGDNFGLDIGFHDPLPASQRSSLFPWDNAGASSSVGGLAFGPFDSASDRPSLGCTDARLRGSSLSRGGSLAMPPCQLGSTSPAILRQHSQSIGEDYAFDLGSQANESTNIETQESDMNLNTLERNSFNFLEFVLAACIVALIVLAVISRYARMQYQTLPSSSQELSFDVIVPKASSTRHVAAAAFYHCLVLATKKFLKLDQADPYGLLTITLI